MVRSLADLCAAKALEVLRSDKDAVDMLTSLPEDVQQVLFKHFWKDYTRLSANRKLIERCPVADRDLYALGLRARCDLSKLKVKDLSYHDSDSNDGEEESDDEDRSGVYRNRQELLDCKAFLDMELEWWPQSEAGIVNDSQRSSRDPNSAEVWWDSRHLFMPADSGRQFELCVCRQMEIEYDETCESWNLEICRGTVCDCGRAHSGSLRLPDMISSQLLIFRLSNMFTGFGGDVMSIRHMPWGAGLVNCGDGVSIITLQDHFGVPGVSFLGSQKASDRALKLLDYLVSNKFPHFNPFVR